MPQGTSCGIQRWIARQEGFEPPTLGSEDRCSSPLSYRRKKYHKAYKPLLADLSES